MWRLISQQRGFVEKDMDQVSLSDIVDGTTYVSIYGDAENFGYGFYLLPEIIAPPPTGTGLDNTSLNDGAVRVEEAHGIDPTNLVDLDEMEPDLDYYPQIVRAFAPLSCNQPPTPNTDDGLYLNHQQLRTGRVLFEPICHPSVTGSCALVRVMDWLRDL